MFDAAPWCDPSRAPSNNSNNQTKDPNFANWNLFKMVSPKCLTPCVGGSTDPCNNEYATTFDGGEQGNGWTKCNLFQDSTVNTSTTAGCRCKGTPSYKYSTGFPDPTNDNDNGYVCSATNTVITPKGYTAYTGPDGIPGVGTCGLRKDLAQGLIKSGFPTTAIATDFPADLFPDDSMTPPSLNGLQLHSPGSVDGKGGPPVSRTLIQKKGTALQESLSFQNPYTMQVTTALTSYNSTNGPSDAGARRTWKVIPDIFQTWHVITSNFPWSFGQKNQPVLMTPADYSSMYNFDVNDVDAEPVLAKGPYQMPDGTENGLTWKDASVAQPIGFASTYAVAKTPYPTMQPCTPGGHDNIGLDSQSFNGCGVIGVTTPVNMNIAGVELMVGTQFQYLKDYPYGDYTPVAMMNQNAVWEGSQSAISNQPLPEFGFLSGGAAQLYSNALSL